MTKLYYSIATLVCLSFVIDLGECRTIVKRGVELKPMDPHTLAVLTKSSIIRDKRKVDVVTGVKNAVLGFVFNPSSSVSASKGFAWDLPKPTRRPTTTPDAVIFKPGEPVSLELPDKLFGSTFTLITNLSTRVGDYAMSSAVRAQRLLESMRPFLRTIFGAGGIVIEATTNRPIFSDPNAI
ncbi:unnamed protein product [Psylliodes chrysocephalus]|uniref:Uncharacterized protein n=1 Tax=Psylliodes chrysocephalus TaxID=3402493 RepID=A0A9P0CI33_9CUCU|nr:unnamed protein product [Psylliodes chrysocephala]